MILLFSWLRLRPSSRAPASKLRRSLHTVSMSPPIVPSSKKNILNSDESRCRTGWIVEQKSSGPKGSPCCTPSLDGMESSPKKRIDGAE